MMARLERVKAAGIALTSTLVVFERFLPAVPDTLASYQALPRPLQRRSREMLPESRGGQVFRYACQTVRAYAHMGGLVLAGTDSYYLVLYPGDLHRELELLVQCGLSSAQALAAATRNPAAWLRADSVGILAPGKLADIVLIRGDPLKRISATQEIDLVVQAGQIYRPAELILETRKRVHGKDR